MTARIPKLALALAVIAATGVAAYLVGRGSVEEEPAAPAAESTEAAAPQAGAGAASKRIEVSAEGDSKIAGVDLWTLSPAGARRSFGAPSAVRREGELCATTWAGVGLTVNFANLGGEDPCGEHGAVGSVEVGGPAAVRAGWRTEEGLEVGMRSKRLLALYPNAQTGAHLRPQPQLGISGRGYALKAKPSVVGEGETAPSLIARVEDGVVIAIELPVGAAGE